MIYLVKITNFLQRPHKKNTNDYYEISYSYDKFEMQMNNNVNTNWKRWESHYYFIIKNCWWKNGMRRLTTARNCKNVLCGATHSNIAVIEQRQTVGNKTEARRRRTRIVARPMVCISIILSPISVRFIRNWPYNFIRLKIFLKSEKYFK